MAFANGGQQGGAGTTASPKKVSISHTSSVESPWEVASLEFAKNVNARSGGRFDVQTYPNGQLCQKNPNIMVEMVQTGSTQIGIESMTTLGALNPDVSILNLPFFFEDVDHVDRFLKSKPAVWEKWMQQFEKNNLVIIGVSPRPMRQLNNNVRIIKTPDDIKGMKFRVPNNPLYVAIFEAFGAKPVPMSSGEIYSAIQLGTVNGEDNSVQLQYDFRTYEVAKNFTLINYIADTSMIFMNKDFFYSLSADDQALILKAGQEWADTNKAEDLTYYDKSYKIMADAGTQFYTMPQVDRDKFKALLGDFYKEYEAKYTPADWKAFQDAVNAAK
jgi:tripartite ATP-independent transporter DctP family solute receptor